MNWFKEKISTKQLFVFLKFVNNFQNSMRIQNPQLKTKQKHFTKYTQREHRPVTRGLTKDL